MLLFWIRVVNLDQEIKTLDWYTTITVDLGIGRIKKIICGHVHNILILEENEIFSIRFNTASELYLRNNID